MAEQKAPTRKDTAIIGDDSSAFALTASKIATDITKIERTLYSALRKAIAPSVIWLAMLFILSVPASLLFTHADLNRVKMRAKMPNNGTM